MSALIRIFFSNGDCSDLTMILAGLAVVLAIIQVAGAV